MGKVIFHVINSIKGGCGKSTFSLLLADYYQNKEDDNQEAYIIDLDWYGTSWLKNYGGYIDKDNNKINYINNLMFNFAEVSKSDFIQKINMDHVDESDKVTSSGYINICMANPEDVVLNDVEQDLFENTVYNVIKKIIENSNSEKQLHIILDMPPSYEKYSDRILNHLLLDKTSSLYRDFLHGSFKNIVGDNMYEIRLYMIAALSIAHIELNKEFLTNFVRNRSFSSLFSKFNDGENLKVFFIVNDPNLVLDESVLPLLEQFDEKINGTLNKYRDYYKCLKCVLFGYVRMAYYDQTIQWLTPDSKSDKKLKINFKTISAFSELINKLKETKKDEDTTKVVEEHESNDESIPNEENMKSE